jgi:hemerythrin
MTYTSNLVTWSASYSVGIKLIDDQHKEFFRLVNDMYNHVDNDDEDAERAYFQSVIRQVVDHIKEHFATEEEIMERTQYKDYAGHKLAHDFFILSVDNIVKKFNEGKKISLISFSHFIKDWILTHITIMDKQYFNYLMKIASRRPDGKLSINKAAIAR